MRSRSSRCADAVAVALLAIAIAGSARADCVDTSVPKVVTIGAPRGAAPSERVDGARAPVERGTRYRPR